MIALKSPVPVSPNKLASIHQYHDSVPTVSTDTSSKYSLSPPSSLLHPLTTKRFSMENASETDSNVQSSVSSEAQFHTPTMNGSTPDKTSPKKSSQGNHPELSVGPAMSTSDLDPALTGSQIRISDTAFLGFRPRSDEDDPPQSVIHAPPGFGEFVRNQCFYTRTKSLICRLEASQFTSTRARAREEREPSAQKRDCEELPRRGGERCDQGTILLEINT